jgi:hypothetical protein
MSPELLEAAEAALPNLPKAVQQKVGALIAEARRAKTKEVVANDFMAFVK